MLVYRSVYPQFLELDYSYNLGWFLGPARVTSTFLVGQLGTVDGIGTQQKVVIFISDFNKTIDWKLEFIPQLMNYCVEEASFSTLFKAFIDFPQGFLVQDGHLPFVPNKNPTQTEALNSVCWTLNSSPNGGKMVIYHARTYWNNHLKKSKSQVFLFRPQMDDPNPTLSDVVFQSYLMRNRCFKGLPNAVFLQCWPCEKRGVLTHAWYDWRILEEYLDFPGSKWLVNRLSHL